MRCSFEGRPAPVVFGLTGAYFSNLERHAPPLLERLDPRWVLALCAATLLAMGVGTVSARHEARQDRQAACQAKLELRLARSPLAERMVRPSDPCVALRRYEP